MTDKEMPEPETDVDATQWGNYGPVRVEMRDTVGAVALAIVSLLLLRELIICRRSKG